MGPKTTSNSGSSGPVRAAKTAAQSAAKGVRGGVLPSSFAGAGNHAIGRLLQAAADDPGTPLDQGVREPLEGKLDARLGNVRVHAGSNAAAAAESIGARAYTIGTDVYLGTEAQGLGAEGRRALLTHETIHTVQQGGERVALTGSMPVSSPNDAAEREARELAQCSPALAMRDAMRLTSVAPHIQRDITNKKTFAAGDFKVDFKKFDAPKAGDQAGEDGTVTFTPSATAPESDHIKFIQIARVIDVSTGKDLDWTGSDEANRNKMRTAANVKANIAPGFFLDHLAKSQEKNIRKKKSDPSVSAFYMDTPPVIAANKEGKRRGKTIEPAALGDTPGSGAPCKFNLVSVAKGSDNGIVYGTALWGFETFLDKGVAKVKNEYSSFRTFEGETFVAALQSFNNFYKNPGTAGAPTK